MIEKRNDYNFLLRENIFFNIQTKQKKCHTEPWGTTLFAFFPIITWNVLFENMLSIKRRSGTS